MSMPAPAAPAAPTATEQGQQEVTPPAGAPAPAPAPEPQGQEQGPNLEAILAENARLKKEAEDARVKAKGAVADAAKRDQLLALAAAVGIDLPQAKEETVESLQAKLQAEIDGRQTDQGALAAERRQAAVEIAALTAQVPADKAGYLGFLLNADTEFQALDPNSADYKTSVLAKVQALVAADPILKATPGGAGRSGAEQFGGAGQPGEVTQEAFDSMGVMERTQVFQKNPELYRRLAAGSSS